MKKIISLFILLCVATTAFGAFAAEADVKTVKMTDVDYETELGKSIDKLVKAGVISGIPQDDGTLKYAAENPVTRAEFCKMVNETFGYEKMQDNIFTDVYPAKWYYVHVLKAISQGYISGYGDGRFGGEDYITREQVCTILSRIVNKPAEKDVEIKDAVSTWALSYVENFIGLGYMDLEDGGKFRATENMTRGELALTLDDFVVIETEQKPTDENKPSDSDIGVKPSTGTSTGSTTGGNNTQRPQPDPDPEPQPEAEYTISYELNDIGSLPQNAKTSYKASDNDYTLLKPENTADYIFDGWFKDADFSGNQVKKITKGTEGHLTFYAKWRPRYTQEELQASEDIYASLEFALDDITEKEELEVFAFDEKGQYIFDFLKTCSSEVFALKDTGFVVSNTYVRIQYQAQIMEITAILDNMTTEERDAFEFEANKLNTAALKDLVNLFDININYGK